MSRILKEPLLHFLALGIAIFWAYGWLADGSPGEREIVVTRGQQLNLASTFERTWRRPPTPEEFAGLIDDYVRQEIAYREAGAMELDRNDIVIRRRLRQKLELLTEDLASLAPPDAGELAAYYADNAEDYRLDARFSFEHVYFSTNRQGAATEVDIRALLEQLRGRDAAADHGESGAESAPGPGVDFDANALGDSIALPARLSDVPESEVAALFGADFAAALRSTALGAWAGPIGSGYGLHLVKVSARADSRIPDLDEVADRVRNDALTERRRQAVDALYAGLAQTYSIRIESPAAQDESAAPSGVR